MGRTRRSLPSDTSLPSKATPRPAKASAPKVDLGADLRARIAARQEQQVGTSAGGSENAGFSYAEFKQRRSEKEAAAEDVDEDEEMLLRHLGDDEDDDLLRMGAECEREAPARAVAGGGGSLASLSSQSRPRQMGAESEREAPAGCGGSLGIRATRHALRKREHSRSSKKRRDQRRGDLKYGGGAAVEAVESEREGAAAGAEHMVWSPGSTLDFVGDAAGEPAAVGTPAASASLHAALHAALPGAAAGMALCARV